MATLLVAMVLFASCLLGDGAIVDARGQHQLRNSKGEEAPKPKSNAAVAKRITPEFMPNVLAKLADECQCKFQGVCTCEGSMEFMDCISDACASNKCDCHENQYHTGCVDMAGACPSLDFQCTHQRAVCTVEVATLDGKQVKDETSDQILDDLTAMKGKKCRLEKAHEEGWLNADRRLEELRPYIEERLDALGATNTTAPWMGCGPKPAPKHAAPRAKIEHSSAKALAYPASLIVAWLMSI